MRTQLMPQTTVGKLVSLHADGRGSEYLPQSPEIPALMPLSLLGASKSTTTSATTSATTSTTNGSDDSGEKTMLWTNIASLFSKTDQHETDIQKWGDSFTRSTNDILQELQDIKTELAEVHNKQLLKRQVHKIKSYINKKCDTLRENMSYGSFNADNEMFEFINKIRAEMDQRMKKLETENDALRDEITSLYQTYENDYQLFVKRENDLMAKLDTAVKLAETANTSVKDCQLNFTRRLQEQRNELEQVVYTMGDEMRQEIATQISREMERETKEILQHVQCVNNELIELITKSNEYHSHRYFGMVEEVKKTNDTCETLKKSITMVDAELSDTKEKIEFLTEDVTETNNDIYDAKESVSDTRDEIYREMDRDYYDLKDYIKRKLRTVIKKQQQQQQQQQQQENNSLLTPLELATNVIEALKDPIQIIAEEYKENQPEPQHDNDHIIIMDESMFVSDSDQDE